MSTDLEADQTAPEITEEIQADKVRLFELTSVFARTHIRTYERRLNAAELMNGELYTGLVSIDSLKEHFQTEAWSELQDPDSNLRKLLSA